MEKRLLAMEDERWIESNEMFAEYLNQLGGVQSMGRSF